MTARGAMLGVAVAAIVALGLASATWVGTGQPLQHSENSMGAIPNGWGREVEER